MTKIRLQSIALRNFKGTRYILLNINGKNTNISGANGSGKTTIYHAYYWCLTGKTMEPNEVIQMLDSNNNIIHKIETAVTVTLMIDDKYEVTLERKLIEDWKALGQPKEELKGTKQLRFFNDIPLTAAEFNAKLAGICDLNKWLLLSDIGRFMGLKMEERRKILMSIAGEVNEESLICPYPSLVRAKEENKSVDELKKQVLSIKKRSNEELSTIPEQIKAQDRLKSTEDFVALKKEKQELDIKIHDLDAQIQGSTEELQEIKEYKAKVQAIEARLEQRKQDWLKEVNANDEDLRCKIRVASAEFSAAVENKTTNEREQAERINKKGKLALEFQSLREKWNITNEQTFSIEDLDVCPTCGHRFTEEERQIKKNTAIEEFNKKKFESLKSLQSQAEKINEQILALTGLINEYMKITKPSDENAVKAKETILNAIKAEQDDLIKSSVSDDEEYKKILKELNMARIETPKPQVKDNSEAEVQKREIIARRDEVIRLLAGEQQNEKIEQEKLRLDKRSDKLAQIVVDCDKTLYEIQEYRKAKVDAVESKVNGFFSIARWRFFVNNISNDDLQEVCICHHNGVDYNSTNGADRINLGVDIVAGLSKAMNINTPLFVDCKESVAKLIPTENQIISMEHIKDAPFTFTNF